ncbi:hypothetical protein HMN09_01143500 [Mycena chlorophos]|uniref:Transmembrane protein n=1 Tax=Mycena chlorophos TaxID=658473 RepID=A0A8H6VW65_MYCCL|nr:hypothetical protein HMN09_01143500 [Mycena chlorophos]
MASAPQRWAMAMKASIMKYLMFLCVQYASPLAVVDYEAGPYTKWAYLLLMPLMYDTMVHYMVVFKFFKPTKPASDEEAVIGSKDGDSIYQQPPRPSILLSVAIFVRSVIIAAILFISEQRAPQTSPDALIVGTVEVFSTVMGLVLLNTVVDTMVLLSPFLVVLYSSQLSRVFRLFTGVNIVLLLWAGLSVGAAHIAHDDKRTAEIIHRQAFEALSPICRWFASAIFWIEALSESSFFVRNYLFRRAMRVQPTLFNLEDGNQPPSFAARLYGYSKTFGLPAAVLFVGLLYQDRGEKLQRWATILGNIAAINVGLVVFDLSMFVLLAQKSKTRDPEQKVMDSVALTVAVHLLENKDGQNFLKEVSRRLRTKMAGTAPSEKQARMNKPEAEVPAEGEEEVVPLLDLPAQDEVQAERMG